MYTIENADRPNMFLSINKDVTNDTHVILSSDSKNTASHWTLKQVNPGQNLYTMQNILKKLYCSNNQGAVALMSDATQSSAQWHLNLV